MANPTIFLWSASISLSPTIIFNLFLHLQLSEANLFPSLSLSADGIKYCFTKDVDNYRKRTCTPLTSPKPSPPLTGTYPFLLILKDKLPPLLAKATCTDSSHPPLSSSTIPVHLVLFQKHLNHIHAMKKITNLPCTPLLLSRYQPSLFPTSQPNLKLFRISLHFLTSHSFPFLILPPTLLKFSPVSIFPNTVDIWLCPI